MDTIEAKKNLDLLYEDRYQLENLNHLNATHQFKEDCKRRVRDIDVQIANIKQNLKSDEKSKAISGNKKAAMH